MKKQKVDYLHEATQLIINERVNFKEEHSIRLDLFNAIFMIAGLLERLDVVLGKDKEAS